MRQNPNSTNYHFKVEELDDDGRILKTCRFYTLDDLCKNYNTTVYLIKQNIKKVLPKKNRLKNLQFYSEYHQVYKKILNV